MIDKHPKSQVVVRFQDCDAFGHLNNARYIDYFLNARDDHLRDYYRFDLAQHARTHRSNWVVTQHQIAYLRPASPGETVTIQTGLIHATDSALKVEGLMFDEAEQTLKAVLWTTFRYVDLSSGRPSRHPDEVATLLRDISIDRDVHADTIEQRIRHIKTTQKPAASTPE